MSIKLVAIGDSLTQGFQSGSILHTEWSYPAMIARALGLSVPTDFRIPSFPGTGLPLNIEELLRSMELSLGNEISTGEWFFRFPNLLRQFLDEVEDLYERGRGRIDQPSAFRGQFHNLAVWGFRVLDSFKVNSEYCDQMINSSEGWIEDDFLGLPSAPMYRTAHKVLNPGNQKSKKTWTQIDNLEKLQKQERVENLILWLGANDCLGTVINLQLKEMPEDFVSDDPEERRQYNLTHPQIFEQDYKSLVARIKAIIDGDTHVFVATIPRITIPPITKGIGKLPENRTYFDYYSRFFANEDNFNSFFNSNLTRDEIKKIDETIDEFNTIIQEQVTQAQQEGKNWHLVNIAALLDSLAVKRNHLSSSPEEPLKAYYRSLGISDHPLLHLEPIPSILLLETQDRLRLNGGLFSLDNVHPSTIGYGIVAEAFLREMQRAGVSGADPIHLDWRQIIAQDFLLQSPPALWDDIANAAESNATLWDIIFRVLGR